MVNAIHSWKPISKRATGRPKIRWEDESGNIHKEWMCQIGRPLFRIKKKDGRKWLRRPKLCIKSCTAVLRRRIQLDCLTVQVSRSQKIKHTHGTTPLDEWSARRSGRYRHNTQQLQETNISALKGIRTHNPSKRAAPDLRLRPGGQWDHTRSV